MPWRMSTVQISTPARRAARATGLPDRISLAEVLAVRHPRRLLAAAGYYPPRLTSDNYKLAKEVAGEAIEITGIALLPHSMSGVGKTLCAFSVPSCRATCLAIGAGWNAARPDATTKPRLARSIALGREPVAFLAALLAEVRPWTERCRERGITPALRLNVYSDIPWEVVAPEVVAELAGMVRLYDYTKIPGRRVDAARHGYDLTLSYAGPQGADHARRELAAGGRVAVVFATPGRPDSGWHAPLPSSLDGYPVIDGDRHDARFLEPGGAIVGLRFKQMADRDAVAASASDFALAGPWSEWGYPPGAEGGLVACGAPCSVRAARRCPACWAGGIFDRPPPWLWRTRRAS